MSETAWASEPAWKAAADRDCCDRGDDRHPAGDPLTDRQGDPRRASPIATSTTIAGARTSPIDGYETAAMSHQRNGGRREVRRDPAPGERRQGRGQKDRGHEHDQERANHRSRMNPRSDPEWTTMAVGKTSAYRRWATVVELRGRPRRSWDGSAAPRHPKEHPAVPVTGASSSMSKSVPNAVRSPQACSPRTRLRASRGACGPSGLPWARIRSRGGRKPGEVAGDPLERNVPADGKVVDEGKGEDHVAFERSSSVRRSSPPQPRPGWDWRGPGRAARSTPCRPAGSAGSGVPWPRGPRPRQRLGAPDPRRCG